MYDNLVAALLTGHFARRNPEPCCKDAGPEEVRSAWSRVLAWHRYRQQTCK